MLSGLLFSGPLARAGVLFHDDFDTGVSGWATVQPPGVYIDGPLRWEYDLETGAWTEQSNIYTDHSTYSATATAPMLINEVQVEGPFTFSARLTAGDDDGFGLIFGYQNPTNFYRVTFARQTRTAGFPWTGWSVDRKVNGTTTNLFGAGTPAYRPTFVNTAGRPFDVTIAVDSSSRLTLQVVDNASSASPVTHHLVVERELPGTADGRVGLMSWGMSGGVPKGFRIQNLRLVPQGLAGDFPTLNQWTPLVPPRADGSTAVASGNGQPLWTFAVTAHGPQGALTESSDCFAGNDALGQLDFTGPTLVAGDETWSNYVVATRVLPGDDDAHGILLRFLDPTNYCRVALRAQDSALGPPRGLSVQKVVNGSFAEVFRENTVLYTPAPNVPYEMVAEVAGESLAVTLVANPESPDARTFTYGPWTISGLPNGKVGLFSWAMARTDFDSVSVQDGAALYVVSPLGTCTPVRGLTSYQPGSLVNASVGLIDSPPGVRITPHGWIGSGSVPASGVGTNVSFRVNGFSRLQWIWRTEYHLSVSNEPGGTVTPPAANWYEAGTVATFSADPAPGFTFAGWRGTAASASRTMILLMDQPHAVVATFAPDTDADNLPDSWEIAYFESTAAQPGDDPDQDGRTTAEEFANGTHPLVADVLRIASVALADGFGALVVSNNSGTRYNVERATDARGPWISVATSQHTNRFVTAVPAAARAFWRLQQPAAPAEALPFVPGSWTLAVLPDTQVYSQNYPDHYLDQTRWIVANKTRRNIKYVLHLGDITNNNTPEQWENARRAMALLDGEVPYAFVPGNHDYGANGGTADRTTYLNHYFPASRYASWPTLGGLMTPGRMDNSFHLFSAGGEDWIVLALEFGPRNSVVAWANSVLAQHVERRAILITHAYLYDDDTRYHWAAKGSTQLWSPYAYGSAADPDGTNDGEDLWQKLVKVSPSFALVINGHVLNDGLGRLSSTNDVGGVVHQMLVNYQMQALGGEAYLRLLEFLPDGETIQARTYSPLRGTYKTDAQNQFTLRLQPPLGK